ncbi:MAG: hypothetical protein A2X12_05820 [Bacteroidetes bacterium GWE2_29_8]|nr:MAG: hypothetical protein A2X12_05820 [Bacteroidetes bacterium GWE2_29_8]OFY17628.1 MAG: hypothetical protein A2X02_07855 [Bacteroidetes bacterium GWF2_29_10]
MFYKITHYLKLIRVNNWIKNFFVIAPLIFSLKLFIPEATISILITFFAFCMSSSFVYVLNDIMDVNKDKMHPRKKNRPIANGSISIPRAYIMMLLLLILLIVFILFLNYKTQFIIILYLIFNIIYNLGLKKLNLIESFSIGINFVFRVLGGCFAIDVLPSHWIIIITFFSALMLIFIKRKSELKILRSNATLHRSSLRFYSVQLLDKFINISATIVLFGYILYTLDPHVITTFGSPNLFYSSIFVVLGIFRFIQLSETNKYENEGDPTLLLLKDRFIQYVFVLWLICIIFMIYFK